ncbi:MAG: tetratricopeptide repeat protein [Anaerolineae bacterium]|nr:tetratricopeptide repeat protein [Anaerolineae bacterium]
MVQFPIPVNSIEFEYVYVANQRCLCGGYFSTVRQELRQAPSGPVEHLWARCERCGSETFFDFDIRSFFGQWEKYGRFQKVDDHFRTAMNHLRAGHLAEAEMALRRVVDPEEGEPYFAWGHFHLGTVLLLEGRLEEAREHLEQAAAIQPLEPEIHEVLGHALQALGEKEAAQARFRESALLRERFGE